MNSKTVTTPDLCWWFARFTVFSLVPFLGWACTPLVSGVPPQKLLMTAIAAGMLLIAILADSWRSDRPFWLFQLGEPRKQLPLSIAQACVVIAWLVSQYLFVWWINS